VNTQDPTLVNIVTTAKGKLRLIYVPLSSSDVSTTARGWGFGPDQVPSPGLAALYFQAPRFSGRAHYVLDKAHI